MYTEMYPIEKMRKAFPSLTRSYNNHSIAYFDGPGGTQVPNYVIDMMTDYMRNGVANLGGVYKTSKETVSIVDQARLYAGTLLNADQDEIIFGANTTTLAFRISRAISKDWVADEGNVVVTEIDHHANVDPWITAAEDKGIDIRTIPLDTDTLQLNYEKLDDIIDNQTKLVAIGLASNAIGTINDISKIIKRAKKVGALVIIDAVHAVPHISVNFKELDADLLFCSAYKFFGPHVGIAAIKRKFYKELSIFKLQPHPAYIPDKLETGTINFEGLIGVIAAIEFIADYGNGETLREQLESAYKLFIGYENMLAEHLRDGLAKINEVTLYQAPNYTPKTPTVAFRIEGFSPENVCEKMAELAIHIESGDFYAMTVVKRLGLSDSGGLIRAGIAPYNTKEEVNHLIRGINRLVK